MNNEIRNKFGQNYQKVVQHNLSNKKVQTKIFSADFWYTKAIVSKISITSVRFTLFTFIIQLLFQRPIFCNELKKKLKIILQPT